MLSTPALSRYIEFMYVSTLLEILPDKRGARENHRACERVSTLLEILQPTRRVINPPSFSLFQPFLRFYNGHRRRLHRLRLLEFQPFLRFYRQGRRRGRQEVCLAFQPFLRFYATGNDTANVAAVLGFNPS